eukprot:m51a1_g6972 hypothetical protein (312) ;mRNA; r:104964-105899
MSSTPSAAAAAAGPAGPAAASGAAGRAAGCLLGLAAGDRNGGPVRMATRLAESLGSLRRFDRADVCARYLAWFRGPPYDDEAAIDTGNTFASVFSILDADEAVGVDQAAARVYARWTAAGINAAHRNAVLGAAPPAVVGDAELADAAASESRMTHLHPLSVACSVAACACVRALVRGADWAAAVRAACDAATRIGSRDVAEALERDLRAGYGADGDQGPQGFGLRADGYAPSVLRAALWFIGRHSSLDEALSASLDFSGPANFCPVLVGSIGGARWGEAAVTDAALRKVDPALLRRVRAAAAALAAGWQSQ